MANMDGSFRCYRFLIRVFENFIKGEVMRGLVESVCPQKFMGRTGSAFTAERGKVIHYSGNAL